MQPLLENKKFFMAVTLRNRYFFLITIKVPKKELLFQSRYLFHSTGASDRSFYTIFNKRFDHLETLLTICRPKKFFSGGSLCGPLVLSRQSKWRKRTFMLPQKYHVSVSNLLSKPLKCFMENEN